MSCGLVILRIQCFLHFIEGQNRQSTSPKRILFTLPVSQEGSAVRIIVEGVHEIVGGPNYAAAQLLAWKQPVCLGHRPNCTRMTDDIIAVRGEAILRVIVINKPPVFPHVCCQIFCGSINQFPGILSVYTLNHPLPLIVSVVSQIKNLVVLITEPGIASKQIELCRGLLHRPQLISGKLFLEKFRIKGSLVIVDDT